MATSMRGSNYSLALKVNAPISEEARAKLTELLGAWAWENIEPVILDEL